MAAEQPSEVDKYLAVVKAYDGEFKNWLGRAQKILKKYRDDTRSAMSNETARFNILWSNTQTLIPAVFSRLPKADASRRFSDQDPVGRVAALLIERALDYEVEHFPDFRSALRNSVEDRFLPGRGVTWVRYEAKTKAQDGAQITEDTDDEVLEEIDYECARCDYVHWKDFGHSPARTWEEVTSVWRWVYMAREELEERFGDKAKLIPTDKSPDMLSKVGQASRINDKAKICEYWDREAGEAVWFHEAVPELLDRVPDPLKLEGFFPCAKPLYATTTSDNLVPVPDFTLYQDQANELDILSDRIDGLIKALRVRGVYDSSKPVLQRLLTEGENNLLIPVEQWPQLSEAGGLKGVIDLVDIAPIAQALLAAYEAQANVKQQIFEITGISDILRGQGQASETATAQRIKGQYAGLRLKSMQEQVALFATEILRLKAQIICGKYQDQTILSYAAADQLSQEDQQLVPQALQLIRQNPLRTFRIEVAADSLVQLDEDAQKQDRVEFITALGGFLKEAIPAAQASPELLPLLMGSLKFVVSGFKQAAVLEGTIDAALQNLEQAAQASAGQPKPDPEAMKIQAQAEADKARLAADIQAAQAKAQAEAAIKAQELQNEQAKWQAEQVMSKQRLDYEYQLKTQDQQQQIAFDKWKAELDAATKVMVARISANPGMDVPLEEATTAAAETIRNDLGQGVQTVLQGLGEAHERMAQQHAEAMQGLAQAIKAVGAPKRLVRGQDGRAIGVETVTEQAA